MFTHHLTNHSALCHHDKWGSRRPVGRLQGAGGQEGFLEDELWALHQKEHLLGKALWSRRGAPGPRSSQQILPPSKSVTTTPGCPHLWDPAPQFVLNSGLEDASLSLCTFADGPGASVGVLANPPDLAASARLLVPLRPGSPASPSPCRSEARQPWLHPPVTNTPLSAHNGPISFYLLSAWKISQEPQIVH